MMQLCRDFKRGEQKLGFDIIDIDGDNQIKIFDLIHNCSNFSVETLHGKQMAGIFQQYMDQNVRPKHVKNRLGLDFNSFISLYPNLHLVNDLKFAFQRVYQRIGENDSEYSDKESANVVTKIKKLKTIQNQIGLELVSEDHVISFVHNKSLSITNALEVAEMKRKQKFLREVVK
jgi:hypothetical protein